MNKNRRALLIIVGVAVLLFIVIALASQSKKDQNTESVQTNSQANNTPTAVDMAKFDKMQAVEKSSVFKRSINDFINSMYVPDQNPVIDFLAVNNMTGNNKITVSLDVKWTSIQGDRIKDSYSGDWVKKNGVWTPTEDFEILYRTKNGKYYNPDESLY